MAVEFGADFDALEGAGCGAEGCGGHDGADLDGAAVAGEVGARGDEGLDLGFH